MTGHEASATDQQVTFEHRVRLVEMTHDHADEWIHVAHGVPSEAVTLCGNYGEHQDADPKFVVDCPLCWRILAAVQTEEGMAITRRLEECVPR